MAGKVLVLLAVAAVSRAGQPIIPVPGYLAYNHANPTAETQPLLDAALRAHAFILDAFRHINPVRYNWGYQVTDPHTAEVKSHYESRYGDLTHGSYTLAKTDRTTTTLYYSVDDRNRAVSMTGVDGNFAPRFEVPVDTPLFDGVRTSEVIGINRLVAAAAHANTAFRKYYPEGVPTRYNWEYDVQNPATGENESQYQSRYDDVARGSFTLTYPNGATWTIYYSLNDNNELVVERQDKKEVARSEVAVESPEVTGVRTSQVIGVGRLVTEAARADAAFRRFYSAALPTRYNWGYDVENPATGEKQSQYQARYDDVARGSYTLTDPSGSSWTIQYRVNDENELEVKRLAKTDVATLQVSNAPAGALVYASLVR